MTQESDGGYVAVAVGETIVTQGDTWDELCYMFLDATRGYFYHSKPPETIRLYHHVEPSRPATESPSHHRLPIPLHSPLGIGICKKIIREVCEAKNIAQDDLLRGL